jgi:RNA polymerase sigma factor (sigma-70 family)
MAQTSSAAVAPAARLTFAEERVARGVVAAHRARLDWLLRVPAWADLYAAGVVELRLPGQRQGIGLDAALLALPMESKHELVRWAVARYQHHLRSAVGRKINRLLGLELFDGLELDDVLSARQWQRLRDAMTFRLGQLHRRYKHAQQLLFAGYHHLIAPIVTQVVFRPGHRADCAQEGALGLLAAIDRVDESGHDLAAYGSAWIRRHVRNYLMRQRLPVQAPTNLIAEASILRQTAGPGGGAGSEETVVATRLQALLLECLRHPAVTLDAPLEHGGGSVAECVPDEHAVDPAEHATRTDLCALIARSLAVLTQKQKDVLVRRFGLAGGVACTLAEIARAAGISHQQAGMRERRALQRLEATLIPMSAELHGAV